MITRSHYELVALVVAAAILPSCAHGNPTRSTASTRQSSADGNPCSQKRPGDICVPELPTVAPVVPGEGRIWVLFARRGDFEIRQYSSDSEGTLARGTCPEGTSAAALGTIDQQPAMVCADFERGKVVFGRKLPNSQNFVWQAPEFLTLDLEESVKGISHFALLDRKLAVVYRTETKGATSGMPITQWRLQIAGGTAQLARQTGSGKPTAHPQSEVLCPRPGVTRCDKAPVAAYVADGRVHVILASGVSADHYLHLQQAPGKPSDVVPVTDISMSGVVLKGPCVSKSTDGNLRVYVPSRSLVSGLLADQGERVGVIEHGRAVIAQGPDVFASEGTQCPPEVSVLSAFPVGVTPTNTLNPQWLRATRSNDTWILGYGVPSFAARDGTSTRSYGESFWVVRRKGSESHDAVPASGVASR